MEFKASRSLGHRDAHGLRALQGAAGPWFQRGVLAYLAEEVRVLGPKLEAVPSSSLLGVAEA